MPKGNTSQKKLMGSSGMSTHCCRRASWWPKQCTRSKRLSSPITGGGKSMAGEDRSGEAIERVAEGERATSEGRL